MHSARIFHNSFPIFAQSRYQRNRTVNSWWNPPFKHSYKSLKRQTSIEIIMLPSILPSHKPPSQLPYFTQYALTPLVSEKTWYITHYRWVFGRDFGGSVWILNYTHTYKYVKWRSFLDSDYTFNNKVVLKNLFYTNQSNTSIDSP